jgi:hypothetical protein
VRSTSERRTKEEEKWGRRKKKRKAERDSVDKRADRGKR